MMVTRGSDFDDPERQSTSGDEIYMIFAIEVVSTVREAILEVFRSIKITMIEMFDEHYVAVIDTDVAATTAIVVIVRPHRGDTMQYREFNDMKPP